MWYEETDIIFGLRASISIKITYFLCYRKIMLASVIQVSLPYNKTGGLVYCVILFLFS